MQYTHRGVLNLNPLLNPTSITAPISPHLQSEALISIGKLFDDGCTSTFTATHLNLLKDGITVLEGTWSNTSGMFKFNLTINQDHPPSQTQPEAFNDLAAGTNT